VTAGMLGDGLAGFDGLAGLGIGLWGSGSYSVPGMIASCQPTWMVFGAYPSDSGSSVGYRSRFQKAMLRAVVSNWRAIEVRLSPERTVYTVKVGRGLGVGRTNVGDADGLLEPAMPDGLAPGVLDGAGRRGPGRTSAIATRRTRMTASPAATAGQGLAPPRPWTGRRSGRNGGRGVTGESMT